MLAGQRQIHLAAGIITTFSNKLLGKIAHFLMKVITHAQDIAHALFVVIKLWKKMAALIMSVVL